MFCFFTLPPPTNKHYDRLDDLMTEDHKVLDVIVEELTQAKEMHAVPRRTMIKPDEGEYRIVFRLLLLLLCVC